MSKILKIAIILILTTSLSGCGGMFKPKKVDTRDSPINARERARKNVSEGKGISIGNLGRSKTSYEFSTSNPMWRASLEILDFLPLLTVDYSGGMIITDWYNDTDNSKDSIKITVRFLSNEIQTNSLKIIVHRKSCDSANNCRVNKIDSKIEGELTKSILAKASLLEKNKKN